MTRIEDYYNDMDKVWSAIILVGSIALGTIIVLISHLLWGAK